MKNRIGHLVGFVMFFMLGILATSDVLGMVREAGSIKDIYGSYLPLLYLIALLVGIFIMAIIWIVKAFISED